MTVTLENDLLTAIIAEDGAELISLKNKKTGVEYIWQGDPTFWGRHAPVLFPFVGRLKEDQYTYNQQTYPMGQHGFARDQVFEVLEHGAAFVSLSLKSSPKTKKVYPFDFELVLTYQLIGTELTVGYQVSNIGTEDLLFSIGGHPAFNVPLEQHLAFEDYYLSIEPKMARVQIPLSGPYADLEHKTLGQTIADFDLKRGLFENDALIYETPGETSFTIKSEKGAHSITLKYEDIPLVGIWSPSHIEAPFVCIEPWWGLADAVDASGRLQDKYGINRLPVGDLFKTSYTIAVN